MRCEVLLFAHLREALSRHCLSLELPDGATVRDALDHLANEHQAIAAMRSALAVAVDQVYAAPSTPLRDGCTMALIPPVSGG